MNVVYGSNFVQNARKLPAGVKEQLAEIVKQISINPFAPMLHVKKLHGKMAGVYSCRVTHDYRLLFIFPNSNAIKLTLVAHRKDIYR
jgi:mRNA-degrading endonuclease RelE of RelBE toxin-antitoxin system